MAIKEVPPHRAGNDYIYSEKNSTPAKITIEEAYREASYQQPIIDEPIISSKEIHSSERV
jgi:hypothetical protein